MVHVPNVDEGSWRAAVGAELRGRHRGWLALAAWSALCVALAALGVVLNLIAMDPRGVMSVLSIVFWWWIGVGAWRRSGADRATPRQNRSTM